MEIQQLEDMLQYQEMIRYYEENLEAQENLEDGSEFNGEAQSAEEFAIQQQEENFSGNF
jgi:hypothetical protein